MKRKILSFTLALCMVLPQWSVSAAAEETAACICETACTEEARNTGCPVCTADGAMVESCGQYAAQEPEEYQEEISAEAETAAEAVTEAPIPEESTEEAAGEETTEASETENTEEGTEAESTEAAAWTETSVCICEAACTEEARNGDCPVCGTEGAAAENCSKYIAPAADETEDTQTKIERVEALLAALPLVEELKYADPETVQAAYDAAQNAYDALEALAEILSEDELAQISGVEKLSALMEWFNGQTAPLSEGSVSTEVELRAAVTALADGGGTITLGADITLTSPLEITRKTLTLNMNGRSLSGNIKLIGVNLTVNGQLDADVDVSNYKDSGNNVPSNLYGGTYAGKVTAVGTGIRNGTFLNTVLGTGLILDGSFYSDVACGSAYGGTFFASCTMTEIIGGIYYASCTFQEYGPDVYCIEYKNGENVYAEEFSRSSSYEGLSFSGPVAPKKEGADFQGWYQKDSDGNYLTESFAFDTMTDTKNFSNRKLTLYAKWKEQEYKVKFDSNGGSEVAEKTNVKWNDPLLADVEDPTRDGFVFAGWKFNGNDVDEKTALSDLLSDDSAEGITLTAAWEEILSMSVPFTTTVKLGDTAVPGETVFQLAVVQANSGEENYSDVKVSGSVSTNGAGSYQGKLTLKGTIRQLWSMLCEGAFVGQIDAGEAGWTYDDTVWMLLLQEDAATAAVNETVPSYSIQIFPAVCEKTEDGPYYRWEEESTPVGQMSFENLYTKHAHGYTQKHDESEHWEECVCGDVQKQEAHKYGEWKVLTEATETAEGEKEHTCSVCGYTETAEIAKLPKKDTTESTESEEPPKTDKTESTESEKTSQTGTAQNTASENSSGTAAPQTGDNNPIALWMMLLAVSGGLLGILGSYRRKRNDMGM